MATVKHIELNMDLKVHLELNESEARALNGIFGYDVEHFLKVFYEKMGRAYVEKYEDGVRSLHKTIRQVTSGPLSKVEDARQILQQAGIRR
jgi:hypothetical protein